MFAQIHSFIDDDDQKSQVNEPSNPL